MARIEARPIAFDSGMSVVDPYSLLLVALAEEADLRAVTISRVGESPPRKGARNAARLLSLTDASNTPIGIGSSESMVGNNRFPGFVRFIAGNILFVSLPEAKEFNPRDAIELLTEQILNSEEKVSIIITGPATNIGVLLREHPEVISNIKDVIMMAGAIWVPGNAWDFGKNQKLNPDAEWNVLVDPLAVRYIWESGIPITIVPLDATNSAILDRKLARRLTSNRNTSVGRFVANYTDRLRFLSEMGKKELPLWDPLTVALALNENIGDFEDVYLTVVTDPSNPEFGKTIIDSNGTAIKVCINVNAEEFSRFLLKGLKLE